MQKKILQLLLTVLLFAILTNKESTCQNHSPNYKKNKELDKNIKKGWLEFSIDSTAKGISVHKGRRYKIGNVIIHKDSHKETIKTKGYFNQNRYDKIKAKTLNDLLENGFPFAKIKHSVNFKSDTIDIIFHISKGPIYHYDSIKLDSSFTNDKNLIQNITRIKPEKLFNYKNIKTSQLAINNTGFFISQKPTITYSDNKATTSFNLKKNKNSSFTGIIGIQPDNDKKTTITGDISINLNNVFHKGEKAFIKWNKYSTESQLIDIDAKYPFILNSPIGIEASINILKQDSTYTTTKLTGGINSQILNYSTISLRTCYYQSTMSKDKISSKSNLIGLGYKASKLNNYTNPSKGYSIISYADIGNRTVQYENYSKDYLRTDFESTIKGFIPFNKLALLIQNTTDITLSDSLNISELHRIGGNGSVRGFNENSIATDISTTFTIEARYLIDKSLNIYLFTDYNICNEPLSSTKQNYRTGFGIGTNINTKVGILSIAYAIGKHNSIPIKINEAKIHIAYINYF